VVPICAVALFKSLRPFSYSFFFALWMRNEKSGSLLIQLQYVCSYATVSLLAVLAAISFLVGPVQGMTSYGVDHPENPQ
jgi:hypothetical protein